MGTHSNEPLTNLSVRKSNDFISAKYKSSLLENQVMAIALTRIEVNANDKDSPLEAKLYPGELKKLVSDPAHIYRDLKKLAKTITGHTMFLEDGKGNFKAFSVVPNADYIDGVFIIKFNNELRSHVLGLEKNYTNFELSMMTDFKKNSSFRIYEVLKKDVYKIPKGKDASIQVEYNISELRFIIGLANSDDQAVKSAMSYMGNNIDWDELYDKLDKKDKKYEEWRDFQRRILKPAQEELEEKSDIRFEYKGLRDGRKTRRVLFTIYRNTPSNPTVIDERKKLLDANATPNRQLEMPMDIFPELYDEFVGHNNLAIEDITLLLQKAEMNDSLVRKAIEYADSQETLINNYVGWLIKCIEDGWTETPVIDGSSEKGEEIKVIEKVYKNIDKSDAANKMWNKIKTKDDFEDFIIAIEDEGGDFEQVDLIYTPTEMVDMYTAWKRGEGINL